MGWMVFFDRFFLEKNSDWIGLHLQVRYVSGRVDVVVMLTQRITMHEMLCWVRGNEFDNRMLQVKKQLRVGACGLVRSFPLLYSVFIRDKKLRADRRGLPNRRRPAPGQSNQEVTTIDSHFSTPSRR
jgi:hypothetical protein